MGHKLSVSLEDKWDPRAAPRLDRPPTFDPTAGFPAGRKQREMQTSLEDMERWNLPIHMRDYCVHTLIPLLSCRRIHAPLASHYCDELRATYERCQYDDFIMRCKEYEREKRLLKRQLRKKEAAAERARAEAIHQTAQDEAAAKAL